ncbi:MAG TPA: hypothetical protein VGF57_02925, partial [Roseiarcus sp.]
YIPIQGERLISLYFSIFTLNNFGFRTAHDIEVLFDRELIDCRISNENLFSSSTPVLDITKDNQGRTLLKFAMIPYNDAVLL